MNLKHRIFQNHIDSNSPLCWLLSVLHIFIILPITAVAQIPVGMITNIEGKVIIINKPEQQIDFGTDVYYQDKIETGKDSSLMITYYNGCRQEWFGEKTTIHADKKSSKILEGKILKFQTYDCEIPQIIMSDQDSFKKAAYHFRGMDKTKNLSHRINQSEKSEDTVKFKMWTVKQNNHYFRSGESIVIYMVANKDVYILLDYYQADKQVVHLIPNVYKDKQKIKAHTINSIGGSKSEPSLTVDRPYGDESIHALVSLSPFTEPRDSNRMIEPGSEYQKRLISILKDTDKESDIHEFVLKFKTIK